jgi:hypothetical protein
VGVTSHTGLQVFGLPPKETRYSGDRAAILHTKSTSITLSFSPGSRVRDVVVMAGTLPECRGRCGFCKSGILHRGFILIL